MMVWLSEWLFFLLILRLIHIYTHTVVSFWLADLSLMHQVCYRDLMESDSTISLKWLGLHSKWWISDVSQQVKGHLKRKTKSSHNNWTYLSGLALALSLALLVSLVLGLKVGLLQGEAAHPAAQREEEDGERAGGRAQPAQRLQQGRVLGEPQRQVWHHCKEGRRWLGKERGRRKEVSGNNLKGLFLIYHRGHRLLRNSSDFLLLLLLHLLNKLRPLPNTTSVSHPPPHFFLRAFWIKTRRHPSWRGSVQMVQRKDRKKKHLPLFLLFLFNTFSVSNQPVPLYCAVK